MAKSSSTQSYTHTHTHTHTQTHTHTHTYKQPPTRSPAHTHPHVSDVIFTLCVLTRGALAGECRKHSCTRTIMHTHIRTLSRHGISMCRMVCVCARAHREREALLELMWCSSRERASESESHIDTCMSSRKDCMDASYRRSYDFKGHCIQQIAVNVNILRFGRTSSPTCHVCACVRLHTFIYICVCVCVCVCMCVVCVGLILLVYEALSC